MFVGFQTPSAVRSRLFAFCLDVASGRSFAHRFSSAQSSICLICVHNRGAVTVKYITIFGAKSNFLHVGCKISNSMDGVKVNI